MCVFSVTVPIRVAWPAKISIIASSSLVATLRMNLPLDSLNRATSGSRSSRSIASSTRSRMHGASSAETVALFVGLSEWLCAELPEMMVCVAVAPTAPF